MSPTIDERRAILAEGLTEATRWVVFEPNVEATWACVRISIEAFLDAQFRDGRLQGRVADEAYFVRCDRTTMTQDDIDSGRLIVLAGVALLRPSEFDIIQISQMTAAGSDPPPPPP